MHTHKKNYTALLLFAVVLLFNACSGGKKGDGKKYDLSFSILKGPSFSNLVNSDIKMEISAMGFTTNMDMDIKSDLRFTILPDSAGFKKVRMTYDDLQVNMESPLINMFGGKDMKNTMNNGMSKMKGVSLVMLVNQKGNIEDVVLEPRTQNATDSLTDNDFDPDNLKQLQGKDELQGMVGALFTYFTDKPVAIGDSWTSETTTSFSQISSGIKNKYTLVDVQDGIAEIKVEGELAASGEVKEAQGMGQELKGKQNGFMKINLGSGQVVLSKINMNMEGKMKFGGMNAPIKAKMAYSYKGK